MTRTTFEPSRSPDSIRAGVSSLEVVVALGLLTAALSTTLPLFVRHARLLTESRQERIAIEELANLAERLSSLDPAAVAAFLKAPAVSPIAAAGLPGARLSVSLADSPLGQQATLRLSWRAAGRRDHPLEMAVWLAERP